MPLVTAEKISSPQMTSGRLRLGNIRTCLRHRYGHTLPDDDAGREDLLELLLPASLRPKDPIRIMANMVEVWAPWMSKPEAQGLIQQIEQMPPSLRTRTAQELGERFNITNAERERLRLWTIAAVDIAEDQRAEQRKAKKRARDIRRRREDGSEPRAVYLATSKNRRQPWKAEGISRATWYRQQKRAASTCPRAELEPMRQVRAK